MNTCRSACLAVVPFLALAAAADERHEHGSAGESRDSRDFAPVVRAVRDATRRYRDVHVAEAEGYVADPFCVSGQAAGAMGVHYLNLELLGDGAVELARPEALIYEPQPNGRLRLVGVEYIADVAAWHATNGELALPAIGGHLFHLAGAPNRYNVPAFYELHIWAWKENPNGHFTDWNTEVSCDAYEPAL